MRRIVDLLFVAAIASAAHAAGSQAVLDAPPVASERVETPLNVAALGQAVERHAAAEAQIAPKRQTLLEEMGLASDGAFPSRGGPLDRP